MELTEDEIIEKYGKHCGIVIEILSYPTNKNLLVSHVDST